MYYELPNKALAASDFPLLVVQQVTNSGRAKGLGDYGQINRIPLQIDMYYPLNDYETVSTVKYYGYHLLKRLATDVRNCLRTYLTTDKTIKGYTELADMRMPLEELNGQPVCRKMIEIEIQQINAD